MLCAQSILRTRLLESEISEDDHLDMFEPISKKYPEINYDEEGHLIESTQSQPQLKIDHGVEPLGEMLIKFKYHPLQTNEKSNEKASSGLIDVIPTPEGKISYPHPAKVAKPLREIDISQHRNSRI